MAKRVKNHKDEQTDLEVFFRERTESGQVLSQLAMMTVACKRKRLSMETRAKKLKKNLKCWTTGLNQTLLKNWRIAVLPNL